VPGSAAGGGKRRGTRNADRLIAQMATVQQSGSEQATVDNAVAATSDALENHSTKSTPATSMTPAQPKSCVSSRSGIHYCSVL